MDNSILGILIKDKDVIHYPLHPDDKFSPELPNKVSYVSFDMWQSWIKQAGSEEELIKERGWVDTRNEEEKNLYRLPEEIKE